MPKTSRTYTGARKSRKRQRSTPKIDHTKPTKPIDIAGFPTAISPKEVAMLVDEPHDLGPLPTASEIGPPPPLVRSNAFRDDEVKETPTPPPTPAAQQPPKPHNKKHCRAVFNPLSKGEMADLMDSDGYYIITPHDLKSSLKFRRVVKTARMYPNVYLTDNMFKIIDIDGVKTALRLNGRNASRLPGAVQHRAVATIAVCKACNIPMSINMLKDFGFGAKSAKEALLASVA